MFTFGLTIFNLCADGDEWIGDMTFEISDGQKADLPLGISVLLC